MSIINEAAQWAVLLFIGIFVFGLTRQLGSYLTAGREGAADVEGPRLGQDAPSALMSDAERAHILDRVRETGSDWVGVLVTRENCSTCENMLSDIEEERVPRPPVLILAAAQAGEDHRARLSRLADLVVADERRLERLDVASTPFCMILDRDLRVVQKAIGTRLDMLASRWRDATEELQVEIVAAVGSSSERNGAHDGD